LVEISLIFANGNNAKIAHVMITWAGMQINGRPRRVKFQLGDQILLCGRPVGD